MHKFLLTVRESQRVPSPEALRAKHAAKIARDRECGSRVDVHVVEAPIAAYITLGRWFINCDCCAGASTEPAWRLACCFECGAVYVNVVFPDDIETLERLLVARPQVNRYWVPGESLDQVRADNVAHGVRAD